MPTTIESTTHPPELQLLTVHVTHTLPGPFDGHTPYSSYAERFWLPVIGPTAFLAWRRLVDLYPQAEIDVDVFGAGIGVPRRIRGSFDRLVQFRVASWGTDGSLWVAAAMPDLSPRQVAHLPQVLADEHAMTVAAR